MSTQQIGFLSFVRLCAFEQEISLEKYSCISALMSSPECRKSCSFIPLCSALKHVAALRADAGGTELWRFSSGSVFSMSPTYQPRHTCQIEGAKKTGLKELFVNPEWKLGMNICSLSVHRSPPYRSQNHRITEW